MQHDNIRFHFDNIFRNNPRIYESLILYQVGDLHCKSGYSIGRHEQYCYEISYIVSGKGIYYTDGNAFAVKQGDIYLNRPGELHDGKADSVNPFRYFYLGFNFNEEAAGQNSLIHIKKMFDQVTNPIVPDLSGIQAYFISVFNELMNYRNYSDLMIKMCLYQIVILAYRSFFESWEKSYDAFNNDETKKTVYEVVNYIDTNLNNISELTEIAEDLGYSYSYLSHTFSKETGLSIKEYYNQKRFEKACELLKHSDLSISSIAESLRYKSIHPFSTAFRKRFGISPKKYQSIYKTTSQVGNAFRVCSEHLPP